MDFAVPKGGYPESVFREASQRYLPRRGHSNLVEGVLRSKEDAVHVIEVIPRGGPIHRVELSKVPSPNQ